MTTPKRLKLSRAPGWRKPLGAMSVARPSPFGNPFRLSEHGSHEAVVELFEEFLTSNRYYTDRDGRPRTYPSDERIRSILRGKSLLCWCEPTEACHADVLLVIANSPQITVHRPSYDDSWLRCRCGKRMYVVPGGIGDNPPAMHLCYVCDPAPETLVVHHHIREATP